MSVKCKELIEHNPRIGYAFSRKIDELIHKETYSYEAAQNLQREIFQRVQGCEKEVFNDSRAYYIGKPHLAGITGTMSAILTNGYLWLYNELLEKVPTLQINADNDLRVLYNLVLATPIKNNEPDMPPQEFQHVKELIAKLYPRRQTNIFTPSWYNRFEETIKELDKIASQWKYYEYKGVKRPAGDALTQYLGTYNLDSDSLILHDDIANKLTDRQKKLMLEANKEGYITLESDVYRLWEIQPEYATKHNRIGGQDTDAILNTYIPYLKTIFPPTELSIHNNYANMPALEYQALPPQPLHQNNYANMPPLLYTQPTPPVRGSNVPQGSNTRPRLRAPAPAANSSQNRRTRAPASTSSQNRSSQCLTNPMCRKGGKSRHKKHRMKRKTRKHH